MNLKIVGFCILVLNLGSLAYAAAPTITYYSPSSGPIGTVVTVIGSNLATVPTVAVNGASATVNVTQITLTIAPGMTTGPISITTPGGTATSASKFTVINTTALPPTITAFTPTSGVYFTTVTITGTNFSYVSSVQFNGTAASTFTLVNATTITAKVQSGTPSGPISVTTPGGTATSATSFTVIMPPTISSFTPTSAGVGTTVTLTGTNLTNASAVQFNGVTATTFSVVNATTITATVPAGATTGKVVVTTPGGTATSAASFTIIPAPVITAFTPSSGALYTTVSITGSYFTNTSAVKFNGIAASTFTLVSSTSINAKVNAGTTNGPISVTTPGGTGSSTTNFTVIPPSPTITSFTPSSGSTGTVVTLTGTNFLWTTAVAFGGTTASSFAIVSATSMTAIVGNGISGKITVTNASATATSAKSFTVTNGLGTPGTNPTDGAAMVWVPATTTPFTMGCSTDTYAFASGDKTQQVMLSGYWIYQYQVTVAQYREFCAATGHALPPWPGSSYSWSNYTDWTAAALQQMPIVEVTWDDCAAYATWAGVSLPTEAQYEYAARGPQGNNYPWGGTATAGNPYIGWNSQKCANYWNSCKVGISTWPVGSFPAGASWCGAQDLSGNVWEWCTDWYGDYSSTLLTNPTGPANGSYRVLRGGSWYGIDGGLLGGDPGVDNECRGAYRGKGGPANWTYNIGFRCASASPGP